MLLVVTSTDLDSILQQHTDVADDIMSEAIYRYVSLIKSRKFPTLAELVTKEKSELNDFLQRICCRVSARLIGLSTLFRPQNFISLILMFMIY